MDLRTPCTMTPRFDSLRLTWAFALIALPLMMGCGFEDLSEKKTLYDDDHAVAPHWPSSLGDLRLKMLERLERVSATADAASDEELRDLVSWTAEVAADTDLSEADWLPIYHASEALRANLRKSGWTEANRERIKALCELLLRAESWLKEREGEEEEKYEYEYEYEKEKEKEANDVPATLLDSELPS